MVRFKVKCTSEGHSQIRLELFSMSIDLSICLFSFFMYWPNFYLFSLNGLIYFILSIYQLIFPLSLYILFINSFLYLNYLYKNIVITKDMCTKGSVA